MEETKILLEDNMAEYQSIKERIDNDIVLKMDCIKNPRTFYQEFIAITEEKIRYYKAIYSMHFSTNYKPYLHKDSDSYISFNKKTNKLTVVRANTYCKGSVIKKISYLLGTEWFITFHSGKSYEGFPAQFLFSKSILEKVWSKKITNPEELIKCYMNNIKVKNISWTCVKKFIIFYSRVCLGSLSDTLRIIDTFVENPDLFINKVTSLEKVFPAFHDYHDYLMQIAALGIKSRVAYWSEKRFLEEHNKLSMKFMEFELEGKDDTPLFSDSFNNKLPKEVNCKFITNEIDCFKEGQFMHNCIYTNYWNNIKSLKYFAISINDPYFGRALAGITALNSIDKVVYKLEQIRGPRNTKCSNLLEEVISKWVENNQEVFNEIRGNIPLFIKEELPFAQNDFLVARNAPHLEEML